jgi:putative tryptophan/tyrosine transport system substrate-binding protein
VSRINITRLAGPKGRALIFLVAAAVALVAVLVFVGSGPPTGPATVIFVGHDESGQNDELFRAYQAALKHRTGSRSIRLQYQQLKPDSVERMHTDMARIMASQPSVLIAPTAASARAAVLQPNRDGPVVYSTYQDPVKIGIANSSALPGRRATGVSMVDGLHAKRLELLRDAFGAVRTVGVLMDSGWSDRPDFQAVLEQPAAALGLRLVPFVADTVAELDALMLSPLARTLDAWYIAPTYIGFLAQPQIIAHLRRLQVPGMHTSEQEVAKGALMAYAHDTDFRPQALADLTMRVLGGEDAGSIPIQRPRRFVLAVRPRQGEGEVSISAAVVRRADRVY